MRVCVLFTLGLLNLQCHPEIAHIIRWVAPTIAIDGYCSGEPVGMDVRLYSREALHCVPNGKNIY